ncbi:hypothetical protein LCP963914a_9866 [Penicillium roqueforti]|nr:hypothetical protein LCP963914a_9866 [Penicillium roqueforti]
MGIAESKILLGKLEAACSYAEHNGCNQVQHVLSDKHFVDCLAKLWKHLPECSKKQIDPAGRKRTGNAAKPPKKQKIQLSEPLKANLDQWAADNDSFLDTKCNTECSSATRCPVAAIYQELREAEIRSSGDIMRMRFLKVLFHHLSDRFCVTYLRPNAVEWITRRVVGANLDDGDTLKISGKIKDWAFVGARYDALCRDLGNYTVEDYRYLGNLFRLPDDVTDRFMLKELRVKGDSRKDKIDSLLRRGICELNQISAMDSLANDIFCSLWNNIELSISSEEIENGSVFSSLKDWRSLPGTRTVRFQNGERANLASSNPAQNSELFSPSTSLYSDSEVASMSGDRETANRVEAYGTELQGATPPVPDAISASSSSDNQAYYTFRDMFGDMPDPLNTSTERQGAAPPVPDAMSASSSSDNQAYYTFRDMFGDMPDPLNTSTERQGAAPPVPDAMSASFNSDMFGVPSDASSRPRGGTPPSPLGVTGRGFHVTNGLGGARFGPGGVHTNVPWQPMTVG